MPLVRVVSGCVYSCLQVFAFICGLIVILLMILCLASSNWLVAHKFRQGLWEQCVEEDAPLPLPFGLNVKPGCYVARTVGEPLLFLFFFLSVAMYIYMRCPCASASCIWYLSGNSVPNPNESQVSLTHQRGCY